jgi:hypothetical protein
MSGANSRADRLREIGKAVHQAATADVGATLNSGVAEFIKFPFSCSPGKLIDSAGSVSDHFACVVHAARSGVATGENIPADNACAVIDLIEDLDLNELRSAHARCLAVKRLQRAELPKDDKTPVAQMTMTVIYARRAGVSIDVLADEFRCLNEGLEHSDWIEMVAVSAIAVISYACQFAGRSELGGMFSPAKGAKDSYSPACYTIPTMMPSKDGTFNKIISFISAYIRGPDPSTFHLSKEADGGVLLELSSLDAEIGLRGSQFFGGGAESLFLQDRKEISKVTKLGPFIHSAPLDRMTCCCTPLQTSGKIAPPPVEILSISERVINRKVIFGQTYAARCKCASLLDLGGGDT